MVRLAKEMKHQKMAEKFRSDILTGVYRLGHRLPSDEVIAKAYGINKRTVAAGMAQLVAEGLISRAPGRGSVVVREEIVTRHTNAVACVTYSNGEIYNNMELEITAQALKRGFYPVWTPPSLLVAAAGTVDSKSLYQFMEHTINSMPYGMIVYGERFIPYDLFERNLSKLGKLVFICSYTHAKELPAKYVLIDYDAAAEKVVSLFWKKGHRKMTFLTSPIPLVNDFHRKPPQYQYHIALKKACLKYGMEYDEEIPVMLWESKPALEVFQLLRSRNITAAALCYDSVLTGFYGAVIDTLKIRIPEDLSVIGFYNTSKDITSLNIQERVIATLATEMLFEDGTEMQKLYVAPELIERGSVMER